MKIYLLLFRDIVGFLRWRFPALLVLMALVASTEGLSVTLLLPLLSQVGISYAVGQGAASAVLSRYLTTLGTTIGSLGLLSIVIAVAAIQAILSIALQWQMARAARGYQGRRRSQLFAALMHARWEFVIGRKAGELTNAIVSESDRLAQAFFTGLFIISTLIGTCIYLAFALAIAWPVTLGLIGCALLMTLSVLRLYQKALRLAGRSASYAELQSVLGERIRASSSSKRRPVKTLPRRKSTGSSANCKEQTLWQFSCRRWYGDYSSFSLSPRLPRYLCSARRASESRPETSLSSLPCSCGCSRASRHCRVTCTCSTAMYTPYMRSTRYKRRPKLTPNGRAVDPGGFRCRCPHVSNCTALTCSSESTRSSIKSA